MRRRQPAERPGRDESAELLFRIAGLLATTSDPAAATRLIAEEGSGLLPFDKLILRSGSPRAIASCCWSRASGGRCPTFRWYR